MHQLVVVVMVVVNSTCCELVDGELIVELAPIDFLPVLRQLFHYVLRPLLLPLSWLTHRGGDEINELARVERFHASVLNADDRFCYSRLESLDAHHPLLVAAFDNGAEDIDRALLPQAVSPVHGLHVHHGVPVAAKDVGVSASKVYTRRQ